jgi:hypothetical protein
METLNSAPRTGVPEYAALLILVGSMAGYYAPSAKTRDSTNRKGDLLGAKMVIYGNISRTGGIRPAISEEDHRDLMTVGIK